jgi:hypothetical protein
VCLILIGWLLLNSTLYEAIVAAIAAAVGFVIYLAYCVYRGQMKPQMNTDNTDNK